MPSGGGIMPSGGGSDWLVRADPVDALEPNGELSTAELEKPPLLPEFL